MPDLIGWRGGLDRIKQAPATLGLMMFLLLGYGLTGPVQSSNGFGQFSDVLRGIGHHGSASHLMSNLFLIGFGGWKTEMRLGPWGMILLSIGAALIGTLAQFLIEGPFFVGASPIAYALVSYALVAPRPAGHKPLMILFIAALLAAETLFLRDGTAVFSHIFAALTGASLAMFSYLFGSKGPSLKPMKKEHLLPVLGIIHETDEDDAAEAEETFAEEGYEGMFVLVDRNQVIGVTGYGMDEQVPDIAWLSWTYLTQDRQGEGLGGQMLNDVLGKLNQIGVRKVFIATSDYAEDGQLIYAGAHKMYEEFGAGVELTIPDFHEIGEAKIIYGLENPEYEAPEPGPASDQDGIAFLGAAKEAEANGVAGLIWEEAPSGVRGLDHELDKARTKGARACVLALPSDLSDANAESLQTHGLREIGKLPDYYQNGLHQVWWMCSFAAN